MSELNINFKPPIYDPVAVQPMRDELKYVGFEELKTPSELDEVLSLKDDKITLVLINSVCGCAAGSARPGVSKALQNKIIPDRITTVFAGMDRDAVDLLRDKYLPEVSPSSPFIAMFKNGIPTLIIPRHNIEGRTEDEIAEFLVQNFNEQCTNEGPSVSAEKYAELVHLKMCGSKIPLN